MKVEIRRDRDGFAIVKTTFAPEYKYRLDALEEGTEARRARRLNTMEALLEHVMPGG